MSTKVLMILGASVGLIALVADAFGIHLSILALAGGALFGKGYGIYEERERATK